MDSISHKNTTGVATVFFDDARQRLQRHHDDGARRLCIMRDGRRPVYLYTDDSGLYASHVQHRKARAGFCRAAVTSLDSLHVRYHAPSTGWSTALRTGLIRQVDGVWGPLMTVWRTWRETGIELSSARAWNASLVAAMVFGMITMTLIYRSFGQSALATDRDAGEAHTGPLPVAQHAVLSPHATDVQALAARNAAANIADAADTLQDAVDGRGADVTQVAFERRAREMVAGYPIEAMLPEIFKQDRTVAAYLIAMAKQESQWGRRVPVLDGQDCYNYWGFRAVRDQMGTGGHTCFDSPADAVATVGKRVHELIYTYGRSTAEELIIWKCGYSCDGHDQSNVRAWKRTVGMYYDKLMS